MEKQRSYPELIARYQAVADDIGAVMEPIGDFSSPVGDYTLHTIRWRLGAGSQKICISTGMHGDEPAGPEALLRGLRLLFENKDRIDADFTVFPCDNPAGWELNTRENADGLDLNREFAKKGQAAEIAIVESALRGQAFGFTLDLHEDIDTYGIYLYERARKGHASLANDMIGALRMQGYAIHEADWIEGRPASGGIIWPAGRLRKFDLPKAVFLWQAGCPHLVTTESPGKLDLQTRVEMQMTCFGVFLDALVKGAFGKA